MSNFVIKIETQLPWKVKALPSGRYVATCDAIGLAIEGKDELDLWLSIQESIQLVFNDLLKTGELNDFLHARGWKHTPLPSGTGDGPRAFDVPVELLAQKAGHGSSRKDHQ